MSKLLILDSFNFFHRAYYAIPNTLTAPNGSPINAIFGFTSMLINIFGLIKPDFVVAAMESKEETERKKLFAEYKAQRKPMDDELKQQIPVLFEVLDAFGIRDISVSGYEGDDVIGSLVTQYKKDAEIIIASNDRDLWQLVGNGVMVMSPKNNGSAADWIGSREVRAKYGFGPELVVDYKALTGDPSDNIPGVSGVGKVTATKLLLKYGDLDGIYAHLSEISGSVGKKLEEGREAAFLSRGLARVVQDLPLGVVLEDCRFDGLGKDATCVEGARAVLEKYAFYSLIKRLGGLSGGSLGGADSSNLLSRNSSLTASKPNQPGLFE